MSDDKNMHRPEEAVHPGGPVQTRMNGQRLGLGVGMTGVLFYLACIVTMSTVPREKAIIFFNSLLHGLDIGPILRTEIPLMEVVLGIVSTLALGWLAGAMVAGFYNWGLNSRRPSDA